MGGHITGSLAQAGQYFAGKIGTIFVRNFFVGIVLENPVFVKSLGVVGNVRAVQANKIH